MFDFIVNKKNNNIIPKHLIQGKVQCLVGLEPMPLTIWASSLPTRQLTPPLPWHPYPRANGDQI